MTRGPLSFKGTDLKRAIHTAREAGMEVSHFEITKAGSIVVYFGEPANDNPHGDGDWDRAVGVEG